MSVESIKERHFRDDKVIQAHIKSERRLQSVPEEIPDWLGFVGQIHKDREELLKITKYLKE